MDRHFAKHERVKTNKSTGKSKPRPEAQGKMYKRSSRSKEKVFTQESEFKKTSSVRASAALVVIDVVVNNKSLDEALKPHLTDYQDGRDQALLQELCYGVIRYYYKLDGILKRLLTNSKKTDIELRALLLLGLYQLIYLRIPKHAVVFETVAAVDVLKKAWGKGLVNAVLRNFIRSGDDILEKSTNEPYVFYSHPKWLVEVIQKAWPKDWERILETNNEHPPFYLRVNSQKITRDAYLEKLVNVGIKAEACSGSQVGVVLEKPVDVDKLPDFSYGFISVQDLSAQLAPKILDLKSGLRVLDACAAPGGKTAHILESQADLKEVVALDISEERLKLVEENLKRLELKAPIICGDASEPNKWWDGKKFDRILIDAPCSGTGVIRRHPDIKILRRRSDIDVNAITQTKILEALWPLVTAGGILVYATCSVLPQENIEVISRFLSKHKDAKEMPIEDIGGVRQACGTQILPDKAGGDGFYYAKILKEE